MRPLKHSSWVNCVAFSPSNQYLLTATEDSHIFLWKLSSGEIVKGPTDAHSGSIRSIAFSSDGKTFATVSDDCTIQLWNSHKLRKEPQSRKFKVSVTCLSFHPGHDRKELGFIHGSKLQFWDLETNKIKSCENGVCCLSYSIDGSFVAIGLRDRIRLWDPVQGRFQGDLESSKIRGVSKIACAFPNRTHRIVSMSKNGVVAVWEKGVRSSGWACTVIDKRESSPLEQNIWLRGSILDVPYCLAVTSLGTQIAFSYGEKLVHIITYPETSRDTRDHGHGEVKALAYSPNNYYLAVAHGKSTFGYRKGSVTILEVRRPPLDLRPSNSSENSSQEVCFSSSDQDNDNLTDDVALSNQNNGLVMPVNDPPPKYVVNASPISPISSGSQSQVVLPSISTQHNVYLLDDFVTATFPNPNQNITQVSIDELWQCVSARKHGDVNRGRDGRDEAGESRGIRDWSGFLGEANEIGRGGSATVFRGKWYMDEFRAGSLPDVAIKAVSFSTKSEMQRSWEREVGVWQSLKHRNVLPFLGIIYDGRLPAFVSMRISNGRVDKYIEEHPNSNRELMVLDLARGLDYLHEHKPPIVHGGIRPSNVFVDQAGRLVIGDYGLSKMLTHKATWRNMVIPNGAYKWMAPELLDIQAGPGNSTLKSDIYAFALTAWGILTGEHIFDDVRYNDFNKFYEVVVENNERPPVSRSWLMIVIQNCWDKSPELRPTSEHALADIEDQLIPFGELRQSPRERTRLRFF